MIIARCDLLSNIALITFDTQRGYILWKRYDSCDLLSNIALITFDTQLKDVNLLR